MLLRERGGGYFRNSTDSKIHVPVRKFRRPPLRLFVKSQEHNTTLKHTSCNGDRISAYSIRFVNVQNVFQLSMYLHCRYDQNAFADQVWGS